MEDTPPDKPGRSEFPTWLLVLTLLVLGVVVAVYVPRIIPRFTHAHAKSCIANLKQIDGAVQQWALEYKKLDTETYSLTDPDLLMFLKGSMLPLCPQGGRYLRGTNVLSAPRCTIRGHTL